MRESISEEDGEAARVEVATLISFQKTAGYRIFTQLIEGKRLSHLEGLASRLLTPEKRAEHVEAYHDAVELLAWVPGRIKALEAFVTQYNQQK